MCRSSMQSATEVIVHSIFCKVIPLLPRALSLGAYSLLYCICSCRHWKSSAQLAAPLSVHCYCGYCRYKLAELTQASLVLAWVLEGFTRSWTPSSSGYIVPCSKKLFPPWCVPEVWGVLSSLCVHRKHFECPCVNVYVADITKVKRYKCHLIVIACVPHRKLLHIQCLMLHCVIC